MKNQHMKLVWLFCALPLLANCSAQTDEDSAAVKQVLWPVNSLDSIGGHATTILGEPSLVDSKFGNAVMFDGDGDSLLVDNNPLYEAAEFTIEIIFKPNDAYPDNIEPRFFHIENSKNQDRRVTIEVRLNDAHQWYLDAYIKSELSEHTLIDSALTHPVDVWTHAAITYKDRLFTSYVNGVKELSAEVDYMPISQAAKTSIGARMNKVHWFNGAIGFVAVTHSASEPDEFAILNLIKNGPVR
jgi:hypothetical protein